MANNVHSYGTMGVVYGKILVVEDDDVERESLAELLRLWGYDVAAASDGQEALQEITSSNFELIVSDAHMPHMSGLSLLQELRRNFGLVSCIIISGQENEFEESEAMRLGARCFLKKPIDPEDLRSVLRQCLSIRPENDSAHQRLVSARSSHAPMDGARRAAAIHISKRS